MQLFLPILAAEDRCARVGSRTSRSIGNPAGERGRRETFYKWRKPAIRFMIAFHAALAVGTVIASLGDLLGFWRW